MEDAILLADNWWSLAVRGLIAVTIGAVTLALPAVTLEILSVLFGGYVLADGVINITGAWRASKASERWGAFLVEGLTGLVIAAVTFARPWVTAADLVYVVAAWAILTGLLEIASAMRMREYIAREWLLALTGALSLLFGVGLLAASSLGTRGLATSIGIYAVVFGALMIALGFRIREWGRTFMTGRAAPVDS